MRTIICLTLCALMAYASSPVDNLASALELLDMQDLLDNSGKGFDLTASFTYLGGTVTQELEVRGNYNLLTFDGDKGKTKTGSFNKTKPFEGKGILNITGSGTFNARGGGAKKEGYFNGGSSTDFIFVSDAGYVYGVRDHLFKGKFQGKKYEGDGHIEVHAWQGINSSVNAVDYNFYGSKNAEFYSGVSKALADTVVKRRDYKSVFSTVFHGVNTKEKWSVSGTYSLDVFNSKGKEVYNKNGKFAKNGTVDDALGTYDTLKSFGLPESGAIVE